MSTTPPATSMPAPATPAAQTSSTDQTPGRLFDVLEATATRVPDHLAIVHGDRRMTWSQVRDESVDLAKALIARGVVAGDHIALWLPNHPEWLLLWLAASRIGAVVVPVNTRYKPAEAAYVLTKSNATCLFIEESFLGTDYVQAFGEMCPDWGPGERDGSAQLPDLQHVIVLGAARDGLTSYDDFRRGAQDVPVSAVEQAQETIPTSAPVIIVFTSGTTGFPKGVVHTHGAMRMVATVVAWLEIGPQDRILGHLPLFHVAGAFSSFSLALMSGAALIQLDRWDAAEALELVEREGITVLSGIPTHFVDLLSSPDLAQRDTSSLRTGWIGGSNIPAAVVRGARESLGVSALLPVYGMTELTSCTTLGRTTDPDESLMLGKGVPLGGYEVAIVDPESRVPVPTGQEGEVAVRGYLVMQGYYREPEATAAVLDDNGWFYTGDLGVLDEAGYLQITGRRSDMFIVGGNNVNPADVERVLVAHPGVKAAHVAARPDDRLGEVAVAFVEVVEGMHLTEQDVLGYTTGRLASFKVPRAVVFMTEWPMTPTGKVQRNQLRVLAAATAESAKSGHQLQEVAQ